MILVGLTMTAMTLAEAAVVPTTKATIVQVERSGLGEYVAIYTPGDSRIAQSVALTIWSWRNFDFRTLWSGTWHLLVLCIVASLLMPGRVS